MIIGSGPIIIGQAAEFDYSGTQACKAIKEEGVEIVLLNSNPASIMTDSNIADKVYIQPLTLESAVQIIEKESPDGILAGFGGQTALNLAMKLKENGILDKYKIELLGINSDAIKKAEDREIFKELMIEIGEPVAMSTVASNIEECMEFLNEYGFPIIIRPAYTLGGTGGGIAENIESFKNICEKGLALSPIGQILLEQSVAGWKEIEYEVMRDSKDNCIIVCNMENLDPVGVHTGDSIVVAPSQTLSNYEYQMLRQSAIKIIRELKIEGGCNVQFALDPISHNYIVIEVNPRVSRSSALASKATGYPIAKFAAKIALGYSLDQIKNYVTGCSSACFEPALDYVVMKIPKWPFDKFKKASKNLGTQMKATGEVMAIGRNFEASLLKALTSLEGEYTGIRIPFFSELNNEELKDKIKNCDADRIFAVAEAIRKKIEIDELHEITKIDKWFLYGIKNIVNMELLLMNSEINAEIIKEAETMGFTDDEISYLCGLKKEVITKIREENNIYPVFKMVDTCSGEFDAETPYFYSCYEEEDESYVTDDNKIIVIGSGPIRIGQGVEFDYCCVHGVWAIKEAGFESVIINNNPETVSTDFDTSDKLYFESLYIDDVLNIIRKEKPYGVIVQFGGQTSINLVNKLQEAGVKILGTSNESIDKAEDRDKFGEFLKELNIPSPNGYSVKSIEEAYKAADAIGYPVVVRPSYVIGGRAMKVVYHKDNLTEYMNEAVNLSSEGAVLIDKYICGTEIEVDAVCDGENILIPGIMEHIERTGIHSGDSMTVYPPITLREEVIEMLTEYTEKIAINLNIVGLVNIQYVYDGKDIYVIEVNPRASRTVPILSKITNVPMVKLAVEAMLGQKLAEASYGTGLLKNKNFYAVKIPVFSTEKLSDVDIFLGPEMKSTGEILGIDEEFETAVYKGFEACGIKIPSKGNIYVSLDEVNKIEGAKIIKEYYEMGFNIFASSGTSELLKNKEIECTELDTKELMELILKSKIDIIINTPTQGDDITTDGFKIRRKAAEFNIPVFTSIDTAKVFAKAIKVKEKNEKVSYKSLCEYISL
ncbi:carbamoyl-phosphate synthase (glutamine-hydrolyzing) large subunit [Oceanirhabdus sp. W0125-5]|uniref:carbamoyl-phosphate synthase (glutamine-hydrolyzing) large subunit n=1 Tax=Oceanirhabdus sp. W0125-5 TaxID=2999116 RepID=UPI0022F32EDA|nr:carbamoyl-phosphate synthase (glutamine-hydrolyzing) large subunit [Oceanirhabdus sp. W0125-5]WBW99781.1 carbamoyl-phosphate synthase (glutamine-hydrolyzing) large subunit [Oceanirhabdus sp. W0125-5]